jgi:hypothetical protein
MEKEARNYRNSQINNCLLKGVLTKKLLIMLVSLLSDNVCLVNFSNFRSIQEIAPYAHHL